MDKESDGDPTWMCQRGRGLGLELGVGRRALLFVQLHLFP